MLERSQRHSAGSLNHQLVLFEHEQDHLVDVTLGHGDNVVKEFVEQREREIARTLHSDALGGRAHLVGGNHMTCGQRILPCWATLRNRADHAHFRLERLDGERHTGTKTATAQRHDHVGDVRHVFEDFKADGALTAQHLVIVEWRHVDHAFGVAQFLGAGCGFVEHLAVQHHVCTVRLGGVNLQRRSDLRHADRCLRTTFASRIGHALRMVARGSGDNAASQLLITQGCDLVVGAANLERSGDLEILRLEQNLMSGHVGQHLGRNDFRVARSALESFGG